MLHFPIATVGSPRSPRIPIEIEGEETVVLLDTGAEVSVLPKATMDNLIGDGLRHVKIGETKTVRPFGHHDVTLEGPWCLSVNICGVKIVHPFYTMAGKIPAVIGIDVITRARLVIDVVNRCVYSHHHVHLDIRKPSEENSSPVLNAHEIQSFMTSRAPTESLSSSFPVKSVQTEDMFVQDSGSPMSAGVGAPCDRNLFQKPDSLCLADEGRSIVPAPMPVSFVSTAISPSNQNVASSLTDSTPVPHQDIVLPSPYSCIPPDLSSARDDVEETYVKQNVFELPDHVNLLFLKTIEENSLDTRVTQELKNLLFDHQTTFAKLG